MLTIGQIKNGLPVADIKASAQYQRAALTAYNRLVQTGLTQLDINAEVQLYNLLVGESVKFTYNQKFGIVAVHSSFESGISQSELADLVFWGLYYEGKLAAYAVKGLKAKVLSTEV